MKTNKEIKKVSAVIITEDHYNALGMLRSLGECGIESVLILVAEGKTYVDKSKYAGRTVRISRGEEDILKTIKRITNENRDTVYALFPLSDFAALVIDENYSLFSENVIAPHMNGKMGEYQNKFFSKERAKECGLEVSKGAVLNLEEDLPEWNTFPAILKPLASVEGLKSDICIVNNRQELALKSEVFKKANYTHVLLEEFICGKDEHMIEVMGYTANGEVEFAGIISKIREFPIKNGSTSYARIVDEHQDIHYENIKKYIINSGFSGLFDIEFKFANGKAYFIECNFRNGAPGYAFSCKGKNIPVCWIEKTAQISVLRNNRITTKEYFMAEQNDLINMLKGEVSLKRWINDLKNSNKLLFSADDLKPVFIYYVRFAMQILSRIFNRKGK